MLLDTRVASTVQVLANMIQLKNVASALTRRI